MVHSPQQGSQLHTDPEQRSPVGDKVGEETITVLGQGRLTRVTPLPLYNFFYPRLQPGPPSPIILPIPPAVHLPGWQRGGQYLGRGLDGMG